MRSEHAYFLATVDELLELLDHGWDYIRLEKVVGERLLVRMRKS